MLSVGEPKNLRRNIMKKFILVAILALTVSACTNAGPFVTSISSDGNNGLIVEKCQLHMNAFMGTVSNENCTNTQIRLH